jgi:hypothetical protein
MTVLAIYAIAAHVILFGFAPIDANGSFDPFAVICHASTPAAPGDNKPVKPDLIPGHACDHCNLCSAAEPPPAPDVALVANMEPVRLLHVLHPASTPKRAGLTSDPRLARGPPNVV